MTHLLDTWIKWLDSPSANKQIIYFNLSVTKSTNVTPSASLHCFMYSRKYKGTLMCKMEFTGWNILVSKYLHINVFTRVSYLTGISEISHIKLTSLIWILSCFYTKINMWYTWMQQKTHSHCKKRTLSTFSFFFFFLLPTLIPPPVSTSNSRWLCVQHQACGLIFSVRAASAQMSRSLCTFTKLSFSLVSPKARERTKVCITSPPLPQSLNTRFNNSLVSFTVGQVPER